MDRVSSLPDELLGHILSFLPTKHAALTSVLSKRWLNLWKLVPNLDIDDSVFLHREVGKGEREEIRESFVQFVDNVLAMQGLSPIKKFSLQCITGVHPDIMNRWISNVVQRGVSDLNLVTNYSMEGILEDMHTHPEEMFLSSTLVKLKLRSASYVYWDKSSLPKLKSLDIVSQLILFWGTFKEIIPSLPVLEELRLANIEWDESDVTVSSASLRKLSLYCYGLVNPKSVSFDTPNLLSLDYCDLVAEDYPLVNMGNLLEAQINLMLTDDHVKKVRDLNNDLLEADDEVLKFGNVVKFFCGIKKVKKLTILPSATLEVLSLCTESIPVFKNLKVLGVSSVESGGWQGMPALLRNCPHLETIIMQGLLHTVTDKCGDACPCIIAHEDRGRSLRSCPVNRLEIIGILGTMKEMAMIEHFLAYFPCLKRLDIIGDIFCTHLKFPQVSRRNIERLKLYNKLSPSCSIKLRVSSLLDNKWISIGHI